MLRSFLTLIAFGGCVAGLTKSDQSTPPILHRFPPIDDNIIAVLWNDLKNDYRDSDIPKFNENQISSGNTYRLPNDTQPESYDITLATRIDQNDFRFTGYVTIVVLVLKDTVNITLHHLLLSIENIRLSTTGVNSREIILAGTHYNVNLEVFTIVSNESLLAGNRYCLEINYSGRLQMNLPGFFRLSYISQSGEVKYIAATQFQPTYARHGFPCYDEPALRARFTLRIIHGPTYSAVSNMPVKTVTNNQNGTVTTEFETTPIMQTYLLAFTVSDFPYYQSNYGPNVTPQRVYARPTAIHLTQLTLKAGVMILPELEKFLYFNYSLPKLDHFAIPLVGDGAMENWGLVIYLESRFLFDPTVDTYVKKAEIVSTVAHELGHKWFGNLVGPQWWTYIWLNEGFATLFEYYATHLAYPEWHFLDRFVTVELHNVLVYDAAPTGRPMTFYQESQFGIASLFDNITYDKSGCVLRMFLHAFVENTFRKGINYYLIANQFSSASEDDLFNALERAVKDDRTLPEEYNVKDIFSTWTQQNGYPLISVTRDYSANTITISQQRYLETAWKSPGSNSWWIPYNYATANWPDFTSTAPDRWLPGDVNTKTLDASSFDGLSSTEWIIFNKQQAYYYRVLYDTENYRLIAEELYSGNLNNIHYLSRTNIIDDAFTFAASDRITYDVVFNIIKYMQYESEYAPFVPLTNHLTTIHRMLSGSPRYIILKQFTARLFQTLFDRIGIEDLQNESLIDKYARTLAINWACYVGIEKCVNAATKRIEEFARTGRDIGPNIKSVLFCSGLRNASGYELQFIWDKLFNKPFGSSLRATYLNAVACTPNSTFLTEYLLSSISRLSRYTRKERFNIFKAVLQNGPDGLILAVRFAITNIDRMEWTYGSTALRTSLEIIAPRIVNEELQDVYTTFRALLLSRNLATIYDVSSSDDMVASNFEWLGRYQDIIENFVVDYMNSGTRLIFLSTGTIILTILLSITLI